MVSWTAFPGYFNARDLSNDDDLLGHMLIDVLGTEKPLGMHYMRYRARFVPHEYKIVLEIVRAEVSTLLSSSERDTRRGVDSLLVLPSVSRYLKSKSQAQINAFATHARRYLALYRHDCPVEIAQTHRYASRTGKRELCVLASQSIPAGNFIDHLQGSLAPLSLEQENMLESNLAIRRDFSILQTNRGSFLLLGPARFVNHDCTPNCTLERVGKIIKVKALRHVSVGEEITVFYSSAYFGDNNCECLCLSCEQAGIRGFVSTNFPGYRSVSPHSTEATNIQNSPEVASTSHFSSMTRDVSPAHLRPRGPRGRSSRRNNHQAVSVSVFPVTSNLISKCGSTSGLDDPCVTCHTHSVSIPDTRLCTRCSRHFAIFGVAWPRRVTEVLTRQLSRIRSSKPVMQARTTISCTPTSSRSRPTCPPRNLKRKGTDMAMHISIDSVGDGRSISTLAMISPRKRCKC